MNSPSQFEGQVRLDRTGKNKVRASVMQGMSSTSSQGSPVLDNSSMKSKMADPVLNGIGLRLQNEFDIVVRLSRETSRACATGQQ